MEQQIKVFNIFNAPKGKDAPHGEEIYEWEYLDDDGNLKKDKKNVKEEINSFVSRVDYKAQIKRGELELDELNSGVEKDYRGVPSDSVDYYKFLVSLAAMDKEQVANIMEQINGGNKESVQAKQTGDNKVVKEPEVSKEDNEKQSDISGTSGKTTESGGQ